MKTAQTQDLIPPSIQQLTKLDAAGGDLPVRSSRIRRVEFLTGTRGIEAWSLSVEGILRLSGRFPSLTGMR
jgi:hypothetical protein